MKTKFFTLLILALSIQTSHATEEIVHQYRGVRSMGMGGVVTTSGVYDEALFGNPANHTMPETWKVSIINVTAEVNSNLVKDASKFKTVSGASGSDVFTKVADSGIVGHNEHQRVSNVTGYYSPHFLSDNTGFAFGILVNEQTNIMFRNNLNLDMLGLIDVGPAIGLAKRWWNGDLSVGINVRAIYRLGADRSFAASDFLGGKKLALSDIGGQGMGIDGDVGGYYKIPIEIPIVNFSAGLSVNNVAASNYDLALKNKINKITSAPPANVRSINAGIRADFDDLLLLRHNKAMFEVQDIGPQKHLVSTWKRIHMGVETGMLGFLNFRGGFNQGYYTLGFGLDLPILKIDLATYGEEIGSNAGMLEDRRYVARIALDI